VWAGPTQALLLWPAPRARVALLPVVYPTRRLSGVDA
jgi:hypothetical protein